MTVRLLLVDDDDLVRTGLKMILESDADLDVVGETASVVVDYQNLHKVVLRCER